MFDISAELLAVLVAVLVPILVQVIKLVSDAIGKPLDKNTVKWIVFGLGTLIATVLATQTGIVFPIPVFVGEPLLVVMSVLSVAAQYLVILGAIFKVATKVYDAVWAKLFENMGVAV